MDTQVRELVERARVAYLTGESWDALELQLHDLCCNEFPHLADQYYDFRDELLSAYQQVPRECAVSDTPMGGNDLPANSKYDDIRGAAFSESSQSSQAAYQGERHEQG